MFIDTNECATSNGGCNHTCHNTDGSYYCTCSEGFFLHDDLTGCSGYLFCLSIVYYISIFFSTILSGYALEKFSSITNLSLNTC